jgi:gliding motility-associated-like protein
VVVTINQSPEAGCNGIITLCDDDAPINLFPLLGCDPQVSGTWLTPSLALHSGVFIPGTNSPGPYSYVVPGPAPCVNDTALVTVIVNPSQDAGTNNVIAVCSDGVNIPLITQLGGTPDPGGAWSGPDGGPFSGIYDPGVSLPGTYWYRLQGAAPCESDSASVTVVQNTAVTAGTSTVAALCTDDATVPLITLLGGSPDIGGSWTRNGVAVGPFFNPAVDPAGTYTYTVGGVTPCATSTAQVVITVPSAVSAGIGGSITACVDAAGIDLANALGGTPTPGGTWVNLTNLGVLTNGVWDATGVSPGTYGFSYTVSGIVPCPDDAALVNVTITPALNAGNGATVTACSGDLLVLFDALTGAPQPGGSWLDVDASGALVGGGVFNAGAVATGTTWRFDYVLAASSLCASDTARVTVSVLEGPNAGCDGTIARCSNSPTLSLTTGLNCSPHPGGTWFRPDGVPHGATFDPSADLPGQYAYVVAAIGDCPADTALVTVNVTQAPNAGNNASVAICSSDAGVNLFNLLGPGAQTGGNWIYVTGGNIPASPVYLPAVNAPGVYQYTVQGQGACANAVALVEVVEPQAPNAGCDAATALCSTQAPVLMRSLLGCSPQSGGSWIGPAGSPHGNFIAPGSDQPGVYTYVVPGTVPCANDTARLTLGVTTAADPGQGATLQACIGQSQVDLFAALGPTADDGGVWTDLGGSGALAGSIFNPNAAGNGNWSFSYGFPANGPCPAVSSVVTVSVGSGLSAGMDSQVAVCGIDCSFELISGLGGTPTAGGVWTDQLGTGALDGGILNACQLPAGSSAPFIYTVTDPVCGVLQATLVVTISDYPDPGGDASLVLCSTGAAVDLDTLLTGTPDEGGSWSGPSIVLDGAFDPGTMTAGVYVYEVQGNGACPDTTASVTVVVNQPPDAGEDSEIEICANAADLNLFEVLAGTPGTGGTWSGPGPLPGGVFDPGNSVAGVYTYSLSAAACPSDNASVTVAVATPPDAGGGLSLLLCATDGPLDLFAQLTGAPDAGGSWSGPDGPHGAFFDASSDVAGSYTYTVSGGAVCADASSVLLIAVNQPADAGTNGDLIACDTVQSLVLFDGLGGTPQIGGSWLDVGGSGGLQNGILNTTGLAPGEYLYRYTVSVPGCGAAIAQVQVRVLGAPAAADVVLACIERDRTYTVSFSFAGGDTSTYVVAGLEGTIVPGTPYTFISAPILTSQPFRISISDGSACAVQELEGSSPCTFEDDVFVPESFSPNGDGVNDRFVIPGIEGYPANTITIFNRWGGRVFDGAGYNNSTVVWDGTSPDAALSGAAPTGTYFYVLDLGNDGEVLTGYIYLNR